MSYSSGATPRGPRGPHARGDRDNISRRPTAPGGRDDRRFKDDRGFQRPGNARDGRDRIGERGASSNENYREREKLSTRNDFGSSRRETRQYRREDENTYRTGSSQAERWERSDGRSGAKPNTNDRYYRDNEYNRYGSRNSGRETGNVYDREGDRGNDRYTREREYSRGDRGGSSYQRRTDSSYKSSSRDERDEEKFDRRADTSSKAEQRIKKIERLKNLLEPLADISTLDTIEIIDSKWNVKPKGFESVSAERAKLSGLFPLPGHPRPVDITKLEGALKGRLANNNGVTDILFDQSKIDSFDSRNSKRVIISDINFEEFDYLHLVNHFNKFLNNLDIPEATLQNIQNSKKSSDDRNLIVEFKNNTLATIALALNGTKVGDSILVMRRPYEYIINSKITIPEESDASFIDGPKTITITNLDLSVTESELESALAPAGKIETFLILREKGTKISTGIAFVLVSEESEVPHFVSQINELEFNSKKVKSFKSCEGAKHNEIVNYETLPKLALGTSDIKHEVTKVIQLLNCVQPKDLIKDSLFEAIKKDVVDECSKFGEVADVKIPRPPHDYTPGVDQFLEPGVGKIFIKFQSLEGSSKSAYGLAGRKYNNRTVITAFFNEKDYDLNLF